MTKGFGFFFEFGRDELVVGEAGIELRVEDLEGGGAALEFVHVHAAGLHHEDPVIFHPGNVKVADFVPRGVEGLELGRHAIGLAHPGDDAGAHRVAGFFGLAFDLPAGHAADGFLAEQDVVGGVEVDGEDIHGEAELVLVFGAGAFIEFLVAFDLGEVVPFFVRGGGVFVVPGEEGDAAGHIGGFDLDEGVDHVGVGLLVDDHGDGFGPVGAFFGFFDLDAEDGVAVGLAVEGFFEDGASVGGGGEQGGGHEREEGEGGSGVSRRLFQVLPPGVPAGRGRRPL